MPPRLRSAIATMIRRSAWEQEMNEELRFHIEERAQHLVSTGLSREDAVRRARLEFGAMDAYKESCREARGLYWIDELVRNIRYAMRSMRKNPGFAVIAVLSLALGIGANTAIFGLVKTLILNPLPVRNPDGLYQVVLVSVRRNFYNISYPKFEKLRDNFPVFQSLFGWGSGGERELISEDRSQPARVTIVTGTYFDALGIRPALGRLFSSMDDRAGGGAMVTVLSYSLWQRMFAGDPNVVSRNIRIDRNTYRVIGVAPASFTGLEPATPVDLYVPLYSVQQTSPQLIQNEGSMWMHVMGRLKPEVPLATARKMLQDGWPRFGQERQTMLGDNSRPEYLTLDEGSRGYSDVRIEFSRAVLVLMGLVAVVFLMACANLASLLLVRGSRRAGEMMIRTALGASRAQLVRQWMTESLLLALGGGLVGLLAAQWITELLLTFVAKENRAYLRFHADPGIVVFTVGMTVAAGLLFGLLPAIRASRVNLAAAHRTYSAGVLGGRHAVGHVVLAGQLAASLVLLVGTILFTRTLWNLNSASGGFERKTVIYCSPRFYRVQYPRDRASRAMTEILERLRHSPQFESASLGTPPILYGGPGGWGWVVIPGYTLAPFEDNVAFGTYIAPGYFHTLSIPLLEGRDFEDRDREPNAAPVVIVNATFARHYFKDSSAIGRKVQYGPGPALEIAGVVGDTKYANLREPPKDLMYRPLPNGRFSDILARAKPGVPISRCESEMRAAVEAVAKNVPIETASLEEVVQKSLRRDRLVANLSAAFGLLAVLLAAIGLYGAMSHSVSGRTREIGIRMALGADARSIVRMVFAQSLGITCLGIAAGLPLAIGGAKLIEALLFGVSAGDPVTLVVSALVLMSVSLVAGLRPARRAARLDPTRALRYE